MIGVDEAGRGSWAGPLLAVAVRLQLDWRQAGLADSKCLSSKQRSLLAQQLLKAEKDISWAFVAADLIDKHGLSWAQRRAMFQAVAGLKPAKQESIIVDGSFNYLKDDYPTSQAVIKADSRYLNVMAASIIAKVKRDQLMIDLDKLHPGYYFGQHKGYGTKLHRESLKRLKPLAKVHRFSYKPLLAFK